MDWSALGWQEMVGVDEVLFGKLAVLPMSLMPTTFVALAFLLCIQRRPSFSAEGGSFPQQCQTADECQA